MLHFSASLMNTINHTQLAIFGLSVFPKKSPFFRLSTAVVESDQRVCCFFLQLFSTWNNTSSVYSRCLLQAVMFYL